MGWDLDAPAPAKPRAGLPTMATVVEDDTPAQPITLAADLPIEAADPDGEDVFVGATVGVWPGGQLASVAGVKLAPTGRIFEVDAGDAVYARGERVMIDTEGGMRLATVALTPARRMIDQPLRRIVRRAEARDTDAAKGAEERSKVLLAFAKGRARERKMPVKVYRAEESPSGKTVVYFSADDRIDFRELARDVASRAQGRLELRQTGVRDEAKAVGGIGACGRELCCTTFLPRFEPVSIKMAKDQGLVLNPSKVTGQCGRLKCCLVYEEATYRELRKGLPKLGKRVTTPAGEGRVVEIDVLRHRIRVGFAPGESEVFPADVVQAVAPPPQGPGKSSKPAPVVNPDDDHDDHEEPVELSAPIAVAPEPSVPEHEMPGEDPLSEDDGDGGGSGGGESN